MVNTKNSVKCGETRALNELVCEKMLEDNKRASFS